MHDESQFNWLITVEIVSAFFTITFSVIPPVFDIIFEVDKNIVNKDSFFIYSNVDNIKLICTKESIVFHISVPNKLNYETYYK